MNTTFDVELKVMRIFRRAKIAFTKYPVSILGFLASIGSEALGVVFCYKAVQYKDYSDFLLGGGLIALGILISDFTLQLLKDEKKFYEDILKEVRIKGFTKRLLRHVDKNLLKAISEETDKEDEYELKKNQK